MRAGSPQSATAARPERLARDTHAPLATMSRRANFGAALTGDDAGPPSAASRPTPSSRNAAHAGSDTGARPDNRGHGTDKGKGKARPGGQGGQGGQRGQGGGGAAGVPRRAELAERVAAVNAAALAMAKAAEEAGETEQDGTLCFICAEPVQYWAVGPCNHRTCHTCSIRLRALYKKKECTFCKVRWRDLRFLFPALELTSLSLSQTECPTVIFTESEDKPFEEYGAEDTPFSDTKVSPAQPLRSSRRKLTLLALSSLAFCSNRAPSSTTPSHSSASTAHTSRTSPIRLPPHPTLPPKPALTSFPAGPT